jgi:hypothetical protein
VDFLAACFTIWGALTMLIGASILALGVAAASLVRSAARAGGSFAAGLTAATFMTLAILALVWGFVHILTGTRLKRRRHWSRLAALLLGSIDLVLLPYGTALGAYALWTLLREDARHLFDA